ncbi:MAG: hypothetical protein ACTHKG_09925 [Nocardioides sp.]
MARSWWHAGAAGTSLALALVLTGCGATDESSSDFCKSVDALAAATKQIDQTSLTKSSAAAVQKSMQAIDTAVTNLSSAAESEFSTEVDAVKGAATQLGQDVANAAEDPTSDHFYAARTSMSAFVTTVNDLGKATSEAC